MNIELAKIITSIKNSILEDIPRNKTEWSFVYMFTGMLVVLYIALINA